MVRPSLLNPNAATIARPEQKPHTLVNAFGEKRTDPYYWLKERDNPAVIQWLEAENRYADSVLAPVAELQAQLYAEMKTRIQEDDQSVPYYKNGYWYYSRFEPGKEYPLYCRKKGDLKSPEAVYLDLNQWAAGKAFCQLGALEISPDNQWLAASVDFSGRYLYETRLINLATGESLPVDLPTAGTLIWANDNKTLFYNTKDPVTLRENKVWRTLPFQKDAKPVLVLEEPDETVGLSLRKSLSEAYIFLSVGYTQTLENWFIPADNPTTPPTLFNPRHPNQAHFYDIEHHEARFFIRTNWEAPNFRLMTCPIQNTAQDQWKAFLTPEKGTLLEHFVVFKNHLAVCERSGGLKRLAAINLQTREQRKIEIGEPTYEADFDENRAFDTPILRFRYSSLKTPHTVVDYDLNSGLQTVRKVAPVKGGFNPERYETNLLWVTARDGARVPVSILHLKSSSRDGTAPGYIKGYGSYGASYDPVFNREIFSLVDRGFVYAIAHIRGGMEMGYEWYEEGKLLKKMNTFTDFIDCAAALCTQKYTRPDRLFASGRSAGGLLMGAVTNMAPQQFKGIICGVPFVDVLTTMSDPSIPLTTGEYTEWGNPANRAEYDYMARYSPYDNLKAMAYPHLMVITSLSDSQVQYFEPAKYVARLRDLKTDTNTLLFRTNMTGSHGGASGRFEVLRERAVEFAWMLGILGYTG
jgi:oligopeptidase B